MLVRHAESEGNVRSREELAGYEISTWQYKLTERGREQARITGEHLRKHYGKFDVHYVSYYARSKETMQIMFPEARVYEDPRLAEAQRGIWHSMTSSEIAVRFPEEVRRKQREGLYHYRPPGGENWPDVELRIHSFLGTLSRDYEDQNVLMVVHGHWLILFQRLIHHFSIDEALHRYKAALAENASVTVYEGRLRTDGKSLLTLSCDHSIPWAGMLPPK